MQPDIPRSAWKATCLLVIVCILIAALALLVERASGQADACTLPVQSVYVLGEGYASAEAVEAVAGWQPDTARWRERTGTILYSLYVNLDSPKAERRYLHVYASRADADSVIVIAYSHERVFETFEVIGTLADGSPDYLHYHPDCASGAIERSALDALINTMAWRN